MADPLAALRADPWTAVGLVLGEPLHPGGRAATAALLDRADVGPGTRLLDAGCGAGEALAVAAERGAEPVGLDRRATDGATVRGDLQRLPLADGSVDVVLAACAACLAADVDAALAETARVLSPGGRLALSDVVVDGAPPDLPAPLAEALCLAGGRSRAHLRERVAAAGFSVDSAREHRDDLLAMRDRAAERVDYEGLLAALGEPGRELRAGVRDLEAAVEDGRVGYVSLVATRT